eukprot:15483402-Alexandrium_andersonii.AAC.1
MSASLVGSEMCIRDRRLLSCPRRSHSWAQLPPRVAAAAAGKLPPMAAVAARHFIGTKGSVTVSYTHLTLPTICSV